jgi:vacuolar-type H+-ATPase subunit I/STV1
MADRKEMTIQSIQVEVSQPYVAGHTITEAEAKALNQVRAENIGNNLRKTFKEMLEAAEGDVAAVQAEAQKALDEYDAKYEFTLASVGGGSSARLDPLTKEARRIARELIKDKLMSLGKTQKQYKEENGEDSIDIKVAELAENKQVIDLAKSNLKQREKLAAATG